MAATVQPSASIPDPTQIAPPSGPRRRRDGTGRGTGRGNRSRGRGGGSGAGNNAEGEGDTSGRNRQWNSRGRGGGRGRGGARGGGAPQTSSGNPAARVQMGPSGRMFGGRLTRTAEEAASDAATGPQVGTEADAQLRGDAPEFTPDTGSRTTTSLMPSTPSPHPSAPKPKSKPRSRPTRPAAAKSTAPDIATRTHEDIAHGLYECPICTSELGRKSRVWSCTLCWTVFHFSCIKKWSGNEGSAMARPRDQGEDGVTRPRQWRCPGCNLPHDTLPSIRVHSLVFRPILVDRRVPKLGKGVRIRATELVMRDRVPLARQWVRHSRVSVADMSRRRGVWIRITTMDGAARKFAVRCCLVWNILAHDHVTRDCVVAKAEEKQSRRISEDSSKEQKIEVWTGSFDCGDICGRAYDCGVHICQERCHPQDADIPHCPSSPDVVSHCPCGKTLLTSIPNIEPRSSCQDPIANCGQPCGKLLRCGHPCPRICHTGSCPPCFLSISISCRCGRSSFPSLCHQGVREPPQCLRVCKATMNCGRHACGERCCPGERKSIERLATKKKLKSLSAANQISDDDIEAEHICTRVCGRLLKCGTHTCPELCHKGACGTCREAIFQEISCNCGRSVLHPPLPCGTQPPPCNFNCERPKACGHPPTPHNCHPDDESCPKCPFLTEKRCLCGKKTLKNQPCWLSETRCGLVCGEELRCGSHTCKKQCHRPGDCEDAKTPCTQACGKPKKLCSHPCKEPCHAPFPCPEKKHCQSLVTVTCSCGRMKQEKKCNATRGEGVSKFAAAPQPTRPTALKCDDECARLERNRTLAAALSVPIDPHTTTSSSSTNNQTASPENLPYADETLDLYIKLSTSATLSTLQTYESTLHTLATHQAQKSARFPPAKAKMRAFVHSLAADWGFRSESLDPEPHRHVHVFKSVGWASPAAVRAEVIGIGGMNVAECVKIRERERTREREAKRAAVEKARAERLAAEMQAGSNGGGGSTGDGWAQVASRRKPGAGNPTPNVVDHVESSFLGFGDATAGMGMGMGRFGTLVLRSGVDRAAARGDGGMSASTSAASSKRASKIIEEVVDDWEEEVEKQEEMESKAMAADALADGSAEGAAESAVAATAVEGDAVPVAGVRDDGQDVVVVSDDDAAANTSS
ncbi:hypothetical protein AJ80_09671 [Polytolypa hystricis UAMH7299]|uniref:R3H domain-containing protein n=1 Tax=Polytolypa hystricis (strain UAMH7299) TaxID=1447883 RepID=A0A2B7WLR0_POLH7|nr:hypothetical protein AJ80_09671 [Polytolypa hystricis UAMH7299]